MFFRVIDEHLSLRLFTTRDAEETYALIDADRERLRTYLPWVDALNSVEDQRRAIAAMAYDPDKEINCLVTLDGRIIGATGFARIDRPTQCGEIGYWLASPYEGHGYMTAAVRAVERLGFCDLGLERIQICNDARNRRSRAIPERLGYTLEGILRRHTLSGKGVISDHSYYGILKSEWEAREGLTGMAGAVVAG